MKKILVTGSNGQLGSELKDLAREFPQYSFIFFTREDFPINDGAIAGKIFSTHQPQYFINAAAYTAVDKAESEKELANVYRQAVITEQKTVDSFYQVIHIAERTGL